MNALALLLGFTWSAVSFAHSFSGTVKLEGSKDPEDHSGAIVFVSGYTEDGAGTTAKLVQKGNSFIPNAVPIAQGGKVIFQNLDTNAHNVFSTSAAQPFDLGTPDPKTDKEVVFKKPGVINVFCNVHPDMASAILVLPNKAFAVTDKNGKFKIANVRKGKFKVGIFHFLSKTKTEEVTFGDADLSKDFVLNLEKRDTTHLNKEGKSYPAGDVYHP